FVVDLEVAADALDAGMERVNRLEAADEHCQRVERGHRRLGKRQHDQRECRPAEHGVGEQDHPRRAARRDGLAQHRVFGLGETHLVAPFLERPSTWAAELMGKSTRLPDLGTTVPPQKRLEPYRLSATMPKQSVTICSTKVCL